MGKFGIAFVATLACVVGTFVLAADPEALPTSEEVHKLYDDGQYQPAIQKLQRLLQLKSAAAQPYDRVDLLMLRGEALMRLKQQAPAIEAFDSAAKEAMGIQRPGAGQITAAPRKPEDIAKARATALLVRNSRLFAYTPKIAKSGEKSAPISLLDATQRDEAFKALLTDLQAELGPKAKAAARATNLAPIIELVKGLGDLRALELVVTKATKDADAMLADVADRANKLMSDEVDRLGPRTDAISTAAHAKIRHENVDRQKSGTGYTSTVTVTYTMRGLYTNDQKELKQTMATCEQVVYASRDFAEISAAAQAAQFKTLESKAEKVGTRAAETLNDDYSVVSSSPTTIRR